MANGGEADADGGESHHCETGRRGRPAREREGGEGEGADMATRERSSVTAEVRAEVERGRTLWGCVDGMVGRGGMLRFGEEAKRNERCE